MNRRGIGIVLVASLLAMELPAQAVTDLGTMFDDPDMIKEETVAEMPPSMDTLYLVNERVDISGQFSLAGKIDWRKPEANNMQYAANMRLTIDARPDEAYRAFAKIDASYPSYTGGDSGTMDYSGSMAVRELYADIDWNQSVFLRTGKQTIAWGVGRYFSPADVLNLTPIDVEDPDAERYGPVALKLNIPVGLDNFYGYVIANDISSATDIGYAAKAEFLLGETELALAGFYRQGLAPRLIAMATFPAGALDCYAETVAAWGSDKTFIDGLGGTYIIDNTPIYQATAGFSYEYTDAFENWNVSAGGQFWYNGEGYENPSLAIIPKNSPLRTSGTILDGDLVHPDTYYAVIYLSLTDMYKSGIGLSGLWYAGLAGGTGTVIPSVSWVATEDLTATLKAPIAYGPIGAEYSPYGNTVTPTLELKLLGNTKLSVGVPISQNYSWDIPVVMTFEFAKALF
jgi:hypothetical protein